MPFLDQNSAQTYYETYGTIGPWITLINGHTRSSRDFRLLSRYFVENGFRCLTFDNRGSGKTIEQIPFTSEQMAEDVVALWSALKIEKSHLMGISMGGMIAQILAIEYPERILKLVLISTTASSTYLSSLSFAPWGSDLPSIDARLRLYVSDSFYARNKLLMQAMAKQILLDIENDHFAERAEAQHRAIKELDTLTHLDKIVAPTLIIHGTDDRVISEKAVDAMAKHISKVSVQLVEGCGHLLLSEDSKNLAQYITRFCHEN